MSVFTVVLCIHIVATTVVAAAFAVEIYAVRSGMVAPPRLRVIETASLAALMLSGAYLTARMNAWTLSWARLAVVSLFVLGALTGLTFRRIGGARGVEKDSVVRGIQSLRFGLLLGIVVLMTARPGSLESLAILTTSLILGIASGFPSRTGGKARE
jgi:hypothetical protein